MERDLAGGPPGAGTGARQSTLREANLALVLRTVCAAGTPPTRSDVAAVTGMSRATASRLVDELVAGGLLDEVEREPTRRRGRPGTPLVPGGRVVALGMQVDVGLLAARVVDLRGRVVAEAVPGDPVAGGSPAAVLRRLGTLATGLLAALPPGQHVVGAGLALPGLVDVAAGVLLEAPNLAWSGERPAEVLGALLPPGLPVAVGNEADLAARAVAEVAPGRPGPHPDFLYLSGQAGVGGAAVLGGRVLAGSAGWAGEVGHVCVDPAGPACRCGSTGCLEQYAGAPAVLRRAGLSPDAGLAEVADRARQGDAGACGAVEEAARALGIALGGALNVLDLPTVVLGGQLGELADLLGPRLQEELQRRVLSARWRRLRIERGAPHPALGATGAALQALGGVLVDPGAWLARSAAAG